MALETLVKSPAHPEAALDLFYSRANSSSVSIKRRRDIPLPACPVVIPLAQMSGGGSATKSSKLVVTQTQLSVC
jgi:hypothetical protein